MPIRMLRLDMVQQVTSSAVVMFAYETCSLDVTHKMVNVLLPHVI